MPLHPVVGRPASLATGGASLAAHTATRELPTDGPFARLAAARPSADGGQQPTTAALPDAKADGAAGGDGGGDGAGEPAIDVRGLTFCYPDIDGRPLADVPPVVADMRLALPPGSRCLLLGANGAGKTTLLRVLGGHHLVPRGAVRVLGASPFHDTGLTTGGDLAYLGGNWDREVAFAGYSVPLAADLAAGDMLARAPGADPARVARVVAALDIDPAWRLHRVSDGQRRRVQIGMGLVRPFRVLLLDEITVDLDVLGRADLMAFLEAETRDRGATIVYATHILDGLDAWPTHVAFVARGALRRFGTLAAVAPHLAAGGAAVGGGGLLDTVTGWLREEAGLAAAASAKERAARGGGGDGVAAWSNGWAAGRMTSTLRGAANTVMRM